LIIRQQDFPPRERCERFRVRLAAMAAFACDVDNILAPRCRAIEQLQFCNRLSRWHHRRARREENRPGPVYDVAPLLSPTHERIAGVLGSSAGAGFRSPLGDDLFLIPHASPAYPYAPGFVGRGTEFTMRLDATTGGWYIETMDYGALEPRGPHTITVKQNGKTHEAQWQVAGRTVLIEVQPPCNGVYFRGICEPVFGSLDRT
jgi:hypothetical protein